MKKLKTQKGITLIALIITIIIMLILVGVSVTVALNGGLFNAAKKAKDDTKTAIKAEQKLDDGKIKINGQWYNSVNDYLNNNPIVPEIKIKDSSTKTEITTIELKKKQTEEAPGTEELFKTIEVEFRNMDEEPEIIWEISQKEQTAIELSSKTGKTTTVTAKGAENATVTLTAKCTYEGEVKTATATVTLEILRPMPARGDFVEYGVEYKDVYYPDYNYSTTNGWRLMDFDYDENTGTYSNVKLISTGIPANLYYTSEHKNNKEWWVEEETAQDTNAPSLSKFRDILGGEEIYTFYPGLNSYYSLRAAAGLYYNFGEIEFSYGTSAEYNKGYFESITVYDGISGQPTIYDKDTNSTVVKSGNELFEVREDARVRTLTLTELNIALKRTTGADDAVDSKTGISAEEDIIGLYRLNQLNKVEEYDYSKCFYWLASPYPGTDGDYGVCIVYCDGKILYYNDKYTSNCTCGVRPVICISSNIQLSDSNGDGALEITVVQ